MSERASQTGLPNHAASRRKLVKLLAASPLLALAYQGLPGAWQEALAHEPRRGAGPGGIRCPGCGAEMPFRSLAQSRPQAVQDPVMPPQNALEDQLTGQLIETVDDAAKAIRTMQVRGAPLIGATASYGVCLAMREDASDGALAIALETLIETRPTAVNLRWALDEMAAVLRPLKDVDRVEAAYRRAAAICDEDVDICRAIGEHGMALIRAVWDAHGRTVNVLTHCNAGWLATVDWGTALAPIYKAHDAGIPVHVLVDETRPRNQGASITAWELGQHGVPHTIIVDNAGGSMLAEVSLATGSSTRDIAMAYLLAEALLNALQVPSEDSIRSHKGSTSSIFATLSQTWPLATKRSCHPSWS